VRRADGFGFGAGRLNLRVGHRLGAAFAAALRREQLDEIGAVRLSFLTNARISSGVPLSSLIGRIDVNRRGPAITPRAMAARTSTSSGDPMVCTVVNPAIRVM
jgi:hypothetical protein